MLTWTQAGRGALHAIQQAARQREPAIDRAPIGARCNLRRPARGLVRQPHVGVEPFADRDVGLPRRFGEDVVDALAQQVVHMPPDGHARSLPASVALLRTMPARISPLTNDDDWAIPDAPRHISSR